MSSNKEWKNKSILKEKCKGIHCFLKKIYSSSPGGILPGPEAPTLNINLPGKC